MILLDYVIKDVMFHRENRNRKMRHTRKNEPHLQNCGHLRKMRAHLEKCSPLGNMHHAWKTTRETWKNAPLLEKRPKPAKMRHTWKHTHQLVECAHLNNCAKMRKMRHMNLQK